MMGNDIICDVLRKLEFNGMDKKNLKDVKRVLNEKFKDTLCSIWSIEDVQSLPIGHKNKSKKACGRKKAYEILQIANNEHDASIGINWQTLQCHLDMYDHY